LDQYHKFNFEGETSPNPRQFIGETTRVFQNMSMCHQLHTNEHGASSQQFDTTFNLIVNNNNSSNVVTEYGLNFMNLLIRT
jgi:hypothetical protein